MKYGTIARSLIALLFVVAGIQKIMNFNATTGFVSSLGIPMASVVVAIVIIIEVVVAALFAYGYKVREMGYVLMAFTALTILVAHRNIGAGDNLVMALKNIAIIGGLMLATCCDEKHHG